MSSAMNDPGPPPPPETPSGTERPHTEPPPPPDDALWLRRRRSRRSVPLACMAGMFPGLGHVYLGLTRVGAMLFVAFAGAITIVASDIGELTPLIGLVIPFVVLYSVVDAGRRAGQINDVIDGVRDAHEIDALRDDGIGSVGAGVIVIALGGWLLAETAFDFSFRWLEEWWPVFVILFGMWILRDGLRRRNRQG